MATHYPTPTREGATTLGYILEALGVDRYVGGVDHQPLPGFPDALQVPSHDALLVVTDEPAPHGRFVARSAAADRRLDVVLLRVAHDEDGAVTVSVDLTLAALPHAPWSFDGLSLFSGANRDVWLVSAGFGPAVEVTADGLMLDLVSPYRTSAERTIGVLRAGAEIACLLVREAH